MLKDSYRRGNGKLLAVTAKSLIGKRLADPGEARVRSDLFSISSLLHCFCYCFTCLTLYVPCMS